MSGDSSGHTEVAGFKHVEVAEVHAWEFQDGLSTSHVSFVADDETWDSFWV